MHLLDFEQSVAELEAKIEELRHLSIGGQVNIAGDVAKLQGKLDKQLKGLYAKLTPAQKVQVARHPERPHTIEIIKNLIEDFVLLSGDRLFGDDQAIIGGLGRFRGTAVMVMGHERGHDTETRLKHNFGMAKPEGYRKAQRLMQLAAKFNLPILSFVDTAGAFPGVDAEARGQAEAIAKGIEVCLQVAVPFVTTIIGEGGSGGAIAIAAADRVLMLEHAIYSVISPEGCASILWRSPSHAADAAEALRLTAQDLKELDVIDEIIPEPLGGAHRQKEETLARLADGIEKHLNDLIGTEPAKLLKNRQDKFLAMGQKSLAA
ncbi:MAG: acetyl-CoA carboxylase carboxyltransferase subunit alpha [Alphaproteobacteria bacterium]|nr:acetyl-CoA carboxylase carboxyltransferase subunit alpha [Alphaproteobacteria bacterium]